MQVRDTTSNIVYFYKNKKNFIKKCFTGENTKLEKASYTLLTEHLRDLFDAIEAHFHDHTCWKVHMQNKTINHRIFNYTIMTSYVVRQSEYVFKQISHSILFYQTFSSLSLWKELF